MAVLFMRPWGSARHAMKHGWPGQDLFDMLESVLMYACMRKWPVWRDDALPWR